MRITSLKTAAAVMSAMMALSACAPAVSALSTPAVPAANTSSAASTGTSDKKEDASMKAALTKVKQRIDIPEELSEFTYSESKVYGNTGYGFSWSTPNGASESKNINVTIIGDVITSFERYGFDSYSYGEPRLAKLSQKDIIAKAKENFKKISPSAYGECRFELSYLSLTSREARVKITRFSNGVEVSGNGGVIFIDQNTGEMTSMYLTWWDGAAFSDPKTALTEAQVQEAYKSLCTLTPYYRISYDLDEKTKKSKPTARIVYVPDFTSEIDAYTGKPSTIWEDMKKADGEYYDGYVVNPATGVFETAAEADAGAAVTDDDAVEFTEAEKKKLEQNEKLLTTDKAAALLKKDKFVALTDNYKLKNYNVYARKDGSGKEKFTMELRYELDKGKETAQAPYKYINVDIDAESGSVLEIRKYSNQNSAEMPKLDVKKANATAEEAAKTYAKDIISQYKADKSNSEPVMIIGTEDIFDAETNKKTEQIPIYEKERTFSFNRFVNGIQVTNDYIDVGVDSNGIVTSYYTSHTENVTFPKADILSTDEAFKKLFEQKKFEQYYDGWVTKDGEFKTYLLYSMGSFTLNAKSGKLCNWNGKVGETSSLSYHTDANFSDIKDIPQREAILELQKYGVTLLTDGKKFRPNEAVSEQEFSSLLGVLRYGDIMPLDETDVEEDIDYGDASPEEIAEAKAKAEAEAKDKAETTRREAAVMFADMYDSGKIAELKGIFRSVYSDVKSSDVNAGHIAIAYAKGFFGKTADGQFHGDSVITRAEAMQMLYDYLKLLSK
ncbi:MAG: S-layer homology domain-containing protein [Prevotella sp.]|nr:S-layer homology domain-containing protein [Prevotella sp.]